MRIVQAVGWYLPDSIGGTELYVAALSRFLRDAGHDVLVAAPDASSREERQYAHEGIPVYRYPIPAAPTRDEARGLSCVRGAERCHQWLRSLAPDVVHLHTFVTGLGLAEVEAARATGARVVVTTHSASLGFLCERGTLLRAGQGLCDANVAPRVCAACVLEQRGLPAAMAEFVTTLAAAVPPAMPRPGRLGTGLDLERLIAERRVAQARLFDSLDAFVVLSDWAREVVTGNGAPAAKVHVNRLGVWERAGAWPRKPGSEARPTTCPVTVGFLGRAEDIKGLDDLVHAVLALPGAAPLELRAVVGASNDQERAAVARLRDESRGDSRIRIDPPVPPDEVPRVLASFDVLCCPSRVVEGGPTVALEAYAVGTPVIGSRVPALSEIVPAHQRDALFPPGDRGALTALLSSLASSPAVIDRWRRSLPAPRTFDEVGQEYLRTYQA